MENNTLHNTDCLRFARTLPNASVDHIVTDPPYLYLKHRLDRPFDENLLFSEFKRILKPKGFVVLFGRGTSFYRWNTKLAELGFAFKEEIVWNKMDCASPLHRLWRIHETVSLHTVTGTIKKVKVPYPTERVFRLDKIQRDLHTLARLLENKQALSEVEALFLGGELPFNKTQNTGRRICSVDRYNIPEHYRIANALLTGTHETSIMQVPRTPKAIHPTQKPTVLIRRLLNVISAQGELIFDPFAGSCSIPVAAIESGRKFIACELDPEYYAGGISRINTTLSKTSI